MEPVSLLPPPLQPTMTMIVCCDVHPSGAHTYLLYVVSVVASYI